MSKSPYLLDPKALRPIAEFCRDGTLQIHPKSAERFAREGKLAAAKVGRGWLTTTEACRAFIYARGNKAFRRSTV